MTKEKAQKYLNSIDYFLSLLPKTKRFAAVSALNDLLVFLESYARS